MRLKAIIRLLYVPAFMMMVGCSIESDREYIAKRLKLDDLPSTTKVEGCRDAEEDGGIVFRECLISAAPEDIQKMLSAYEFRTVNAPDGAVGYMASPGYMGVHGIRVFFNEATRKGTVEIYEP